MTGLKELQTLLFSPGDSKRRLLSALRAPTGAVVADWEDGVAASDKATARVVTAETFESADRTAVLRTVRINARDSREHALDLAALQALDVDAIIVPKVTASDLSSWEPVGRPIIAIVETARGLRDAFDIADHPRVVALALGAIDLAAELRTTRTAAGDELLYARSHLVVASAAAGLRSPIDTAFIDLEDSVGLRSETQRARVLGFGGKFCVHPRQLSVVKDAFAPTAAEIAWAREVVAGARNRGELDGGAIRVGSTMVDAPVLATAEWILREASAHAQG